MGGYCNTLDSRLRKRSSQHQHQLWLHRPPKGVNFLRNIVIASKPSRGCMNGYEGGVDVLNKFKICTILEPTTTKRKKATRYLLTGESSSCSAAFPTGTFPLLLIFFSNLELRFLILRGRTWVDGSCG